MVPRDEPKREIVEAYNGLSSRYDRAYTDAACRAEDAWLRDQLEPMLNHGLEGAIVDLGAGTGFLFDLMPISPSQYLGLDISPGMLQVARDKFPDHLFLEHDMERPWPIAEGTAGAVVGLWSLNYSLTPDRTVRHMAQALRPGGRFFFIVYAERWPQRHTYCEQVHVKRRLYSHTDLYDLFDTGHFDDVQVTPLSRWVDVVKHGPDRLARVALALERETLLRVAPSQAFYMVASGTRRRNDVFVKEA